MNTAERTSEARDNFINNLRDVIASAQELLKSTGEQTDENYRNAKAKFASTVSSAKAGLNDAQESAIARTKAAAATTNEYVQENPWRSVGIAAVAGVLIGLFLSRSE